MVHLQFTDNLWGADAARAARELVDVRACVAGPVVVTLHDVPDPDDEPGRWERRRRAYATVGGAADHLVVNSRHELGWLRAVGTTTAASVVPNPVAVVPTPGVEAVRHWSGRLRTALGRDRVVGLLGWVHPGKRYDRVLDELSGRGDLGVALLGAASAGHDRDVVDLLRRAERRGLALVTTGWLSDADQAAAMQAVDHAVVSHPRPSASGSVMAWLASGAVPLVRASDYARELQRRAGHLVETWEEGGLAAALERVPHHPVATGRPPGTDVGTHLGEGHELSPVRAAMRHLDLYRSLS